MQARWWKRHTPALEQRGARRPVCGHCRQAWPCHSWACWDGQLGEAVAMPAPAAENLTDPTGQLREPSPIHARAVDPAVDMHAQKSAA
ncbi:hypothetical protein L0U85_16000 [Glycomyces sp. L485]|uniref:hypothetical protein n=1 Tax=Glycomyces sp. L485 TaxID=2909235 RepID=UPI001F4AB191|nr:hypothetical protein [Glycomyces sp. L485]MCH7232344.1 hypothetical protein [Glycomyces sp. L485]